MKICEMNDKAIEEAMDKLDSQKLAKRLTSSLRDPAVPMLVSVWDEKEEDSHLVIAKGETAQIVMLVEATLQRLHDMLESEKKNLGKWMVGQILKDVASAVFDEYDGEKRFDA